MTPYDTALYRLRDLANDLDAWPLVPPQTAVAMSGLVQARAYGRDAAVSAAVVSGLARVAPNRASSLLAHLAALLYAYAPGVRLCRQRGGGHNNPPLYWLELRGADAANPSAFATVHADAAAHSHAYLSGVHDHLGSDERKRLLTAYQTAYVEGAKAPVA